MTLGRENWKTHVPGTAWPNVQPNSRHRKSQWNQYFSDAAICISSAHLPWLWCSPERRCCQFFLVNIPHFFHPFLWSLDNLSAQLRNLDSRKKIRNVVKNWPFLSMAFEALKMKTLFTIYAITHTLCDIYSTITCFGRLPIKASTATSGENVLQKLEWGPPWAIIMTGVEYGSPLFFPKYV